MEKGLWMLVIENNLTPENEKRHVKTSTTIGNI